MNLERVTLGEIVKPRREKGLPADDPGLPFLGLEHVEAHTMRILGTVSAGTMRSSANRFYSGDVLYGRLRPYLNKVCLPHFEGYCSAEFIVFPKNEIIESAYLKLLLNSRGFVSFASHLNAGDRPRVDFDQLSSFSFLLPSLPHQRRIIETVEKLFSELDKGIESLKTAREQLKVYRQAVLKNAFEGKLTACWREETKERLETPNDVLERILHEREIAYQQNNLKHTDAVNLRETRDTVDKKPKRQTRLIKPPVTSVPELNDLPHIPFGWQWVTLSTVAEIIQIGPFGSLLHKADYVADGTPLINPSHIINGKISPDFKLSVSQEKLQELTKYVMQENDIVIGRRGEMGRCAVITSNEAGWLCGTGSMFIRLASSLNADYFSFFLRSKLIRDYLENSSIGTTMQNLNESILHRVPVPLCSMLEQTQLASEIRRLYSLVDDLEQVIEKEIARTTTLRYSILRKAISGELVTHDPNDEPASLLLERIKAEKAAESKGENRSLRGRKA